HDHRFIAVKALLQCGKKVTVEFLLAGKFARMIAAIALGKIAVDHPQGTKAGQIEIALDEAPLGLFTVVLEALAYRLHSFSIEQGDAVVALLSVKVHLVAKSIDGLERKFLVSNLGFLQTVDIR